MLLLSALGSPGYALPMKPLIHSARDFSLQFESFKNWSNANKINRSRLYMRNLRNNNFNSHNFIN